MIKMTKYRIEKNIPIPTFSRSRKYPFDKMKIGDSFLVSLGEDRSVRNCAAAAGRRHNMKFICRQTSGENNIRVWRLK